MAAWALWARCPQISTTVALEDPPGTVFQPVWSRNVQAETGSDRHVSCRKQRLKGPGRTPLTSHEGVLPVTAVQVSVLPTPLLEHYPGQCASPPPLHKAPAVLVLQMSKQDTERTNNFPKVTQLVHSRARTYTPLSGSRAVHRAPPPSGSLGRGFVKEEHELQPESTRTPCTTGNSPKASQEQTQASSPGRPRLGVGSTLCSQASIQLPRWRRRALQSHHGG